MLIIVVIAPYALTITKRRCVEVILERLGELGLLGIACFFRDFADLHTGGRELCRSPFHTNLGLVFLEAVSVLLFEILLDGGVAHTVLFGKLSRSVLCTEVLGRQR